MEYGRYGMIGRKGLDLCEEAQGENVKTCLYPAKEGLQKSSDVLKFSLFEFHCRLFFRISLDNLKIPCYDV